ncbi:hypothetical protein ASG14_09995 [Pedobacter sp. Leaf194]|nr:hypothetical protein ASG14_09995 [Pedobacter sp. Leaf194]
MSVAQSLTGYEIEVNVSHVNTKKIFLTTMKRTPAQNLYWPVIDSTSIIDGKGIFKRDSVLAEPSWSSGIYYVDTLSGKRMDFSFHNKAQNMGKHGNFILENARIKIYGDMKDASGLTITGSNETDMNMRYGLLQPNTSKINKLIDAAKKKGDNKGLSVALSAKNDSVRSFKQLLNKLTEQHPTSWMILINVYQNASLLTPSELAEITGKFDKTLLATPKGKSLVNFTQRSKSLVIGAKFPTFNYVNSDGKRTTLDNVKGKRGTLIIFWASWCGPCRREIPELKKIYKSYTPKGINMVSISTDHDIVAWRQAMKEESMAWTNLSNLPGDGKIINSTYNIYAIPSVFLLDAENKIVMPDEYDIPTIREYIEKLLSRG